MRFNKLSLLATIVPFLTSLHTTTTSAFQITSRRNILQSITYSQPQRGFHQSTTNRGSTAIHAASSTNDLSSSDTEIIWNTRQKCWRPTIQDVERISWGKPAKKKGTGSRGVPHRLNDEERKLFDQARRKGFLEVVGSGWRAQRSDAPLLNTYRSLCDARGQACICVHKGSTGLDDSVVIDLSPLRLPETFDSLGEDIISFIDLPVETQIGADDTDLGDDDNNDGDDEKSMNDDDVEGEDPDLLIWNDRPIYQLRPYCISWETDRSQGKSIGKKLAAVFKTAEPKASKSKKPNHVKHGKNRRSGGYGIG